MRLSGQCSIARLINYIRIRVRYCLIYVIYGVGVGVGDRDY